MKLKLLQAGYCTQLERIARRNGRLRNIAFPASFAWIDHPKAGVVLFDTGYSRHVFDSMKTFPYRIYGLLTPIHLTQGDSAREQLEAAGIHADDVHCIILSHLHADHIGGCRDFPNAQFVCSSRDYNEVVGKKGFRALKEAFIPTLLPEDFSQRVQFMEDKNQVATPFGDSAFSHGYDILGDGTVIGIPMPGHSAGQFGIYVKNGGRDILLVSDACWLTQTYTDMVLPGMLASLAIKDAKQYAQTIKNIHDFSVQYPDVVIVPAHCASTLNSIMDKGL